MAMYRVDELDGALLDAAVAKAEGLRYAVEFFAIKNPDPERHMTCWLLGQEGKPDFKRPYSPSQDERGDKIIDREHIAAIFLEEQWRAWMPEAGNFDGYDPGCWLFEQCATQAHGSGPTRRVAAMRAFVCKKLGKEIDL
jgi:hypothetical protein